jgi:thiamine pyrophosphate-dependent acetolactate synthase large subunit-like protein
MVERRRRPSQVEQAPIASEAAPSPSETSPIVFAEAVREAKEILKQNDMSQMRLGELADQVGTHYGEGRLKAFAKAIGIAACTVERHRDVYRKWKEIPAPGRPLSYSVARELATHPEREQIVRDNPNITKAEACKVMRQHRKQTKKTDSWTQTEAKRWFQGVVKRVQEVTRDAAIVDRELTPEQRKVLRNVVEPNLFPDLREGGEALPRLVGFFEQLIAEPADDAPAGDTTVEPAEDATVELQDAA